jgi:hypothetical protein
MCGLCHCCHNIYVNCTLRMLYIVRRPLMTLSMHCCCTKTTNPACMLQMLHAQTAAAAHTKGHKTRCAFFSTIVNAAPTQLPATGPPHASMTLYCMPAVAASQDMRAFTADLLYRVNQGVGAAVCTSSASSKPPPLNTGHAVRSQAFTELRSHVCAPKCANICALCAATCATMCALCCYCLGAAASPTGPRRPAACLHCASSGTATGKKGQACCRRR